ncbi:hypothetical protein [Oryza sativa Japonica Group]|uniref:Uncharacterized protein n=1 Tax=Oryza sativa subsp. japonica TaxID=39947 RepID=Q5Z8B1_ORYSJ|nr:hypothetical protein [Oryza sativa Japonica Group]BAD53958.1 hypothetical protein [Oryza sativa Japonica Group]
MDRESTWQKMTLECLGYHADGTFGTPTSLPDHALATTAMRAEVVQASKILFLLDFISSCKEDAISNRHKIERSSPPWSPLKPTDHFPRRHRQPDFAGLRARRGQRGCGDGDDRRRGGGGGRSCEQAAEEGRRGRSSVRAPPLAATHKAHEAAAGGGATGRRQRAAGGPGGGGRSDGRCTRRTVLPEDRATTWGAAGRQSRREAGKHVAEEEDGADGERDGECEDAAAVVVHGRRSRASALNGVAGGSVTATGDAVGRRAGRPVRVAEGGVVTELDRPSPFSRQGTRKRGGRRCR